MSGIAGIARFDGAPVEPGLIERMTGAMAGRGPDGIRHWRGGAAALGQCMLRTTPEAMVEVQPLANEDQSVVLVLDGRVDNRDELQSALVARGARLRDRSDAELVLRAYEAWGEECPRHIIGEFAFFVWDARERRLFGARDAVGTRFFHYHAAKDWFSFSSTIGGLLAPGRIEPRLNETRLLDYLVTEYDRDDEVGTFYESIFRLPAGHSMSASGRGVRTWRYWSPGDMPPLAFRSQAECAEAFLELFRMAVKCRLRSNGPVGTALSGGIDSPSIACLIRKEFRGELAQPLQTYSLILEDREACAEWQGIREVLRDGWFDSTLITSAMAADVCDPYVEGIAALDEPFAFSHGLCESLVFEAARDKGCRIVMDGMAADLYFHGPETSLGVILREGRFDRIPALLSGLRQHGELRAGLPGLAWSALHWATPEALRAVYRSFRDTHGRLDDDQTLLHRSLARRHAAQRRQLRRPAPGRSPERSEQELHAGNFTSGMLSLAHEIYGQIALDRGVEPRSPYSDRRLVEFAIRMPLEAKLFGPWYKQLLRNAFAGVLPEPVRWQRGSGVNPGGQIHDAFIATMARDCKGTWDRQKIENALAPWVDSARFRWAWNKYAATSDATAGYSIFRLAVLARWLDARRPRAPIDEARSVVPEAVSIGPRGHAMVN